MNYSKAIFLISDQVRAVAAVYEPDENAKRTLFKTFDHNLRVDDYVLVASDTRHNMTVCKVVETNIDIDIESGEEIKWIIGKVDRADFQETKRQEDEAIAKIKAAEKRRKRDELRASLIANAEDDLKALPIYSDTAAQIEKSAK